MTGTEPPRPPDRDPRPAAERDSRGLGWRFLLLLLFVIALQALQLIVGLLAVAQFLFAWLGAGPEPRLCRFADGLARYLGQVVRYLGWAERRAPFPFGAWPPRGAVSADQEQQK